MVDNKENSKSSSASESLSFGEKVFYCVLGVLILCVVVYSLLPRSSEDRAKDSAPEPQTVTEAVPQPEWAVPEEWMELPELLRRGALEQAEQRLADIDIAAERPAEQLYILGLLAAYFSDTDNAGRLLERASAAKPAILDGISSDLVQARISEISLTTEDLYRTEFDTEDAQYIARAFVYRCIAEGVLDGVPSGVQQADALVDWTRRMIAPFEPHAHNALPLIIMARGYGVADRMCWAMLAVARQKGIPGFMVHLFDKERKSSPHTICQIFPGDVPVLCDPYNGIVFRTSDGEPLDLFHARRDPLALNRYPPYADGLSKFIKHALVRHWPTEAQAVYPRMKFLQQFADRLPLSPRLYEDMDAANDHLYQYLVALPNGSYTYREISPAMAIYPFQVLDSFRDNKHLAYVATYMEPYRTINFARLLHLKSQYRPAIRGYTEAAGVEQMPETQELATLFRAQCLYELRNFEESRNEFEAFLEKYPQTLWKGQVEYYLGLITQRSNSLAGDRIEDDSGDQE